MSSSTPELPLNEPLIPIVTTEVFDAFCASTEETDALLSSAADDLFAHQLSIARLLDILIESHARDADEASNMALAVVSVYKILKMQAESQSLEAMFGPES